MILGHWTVSLTLAVDAVSQLLTCSVGARRLTDSPRSSALLSLSPSSSSIDYKKRDSTRLLEHTNHARSYAMSPAVTDVSESTVSILVVAVMPVVSIITES